ncbi:MAG: aerobic carbon-monoxide dehydrogenase small subunit [Actinomycetota bacterium]|nr:aerobic carbon-monoxide dehydrogenase small subunit [Actinomycetota bacterium]
MHISLGVNGQPVEADLEPRMLLVHYLRDVLALTGTQVGCDTTTCGSCTILLDGMAVKSCGLFAVQAAGREITTVEGLAPHGHLNPVQEGFKECFALQCGFCTPGMILASIALLTSNPDPSEDEVRWALSGNICRCTGYVNIVKAVQWAAQKMKATAAPPTGMGAILAGNAGMAGPGSTPGSSSGSSHGGRDGA